MMQPRVLLMQVIGIFLITQASFGISAASELRLRGGSTSYQGRHEIYLNDQWGTVCDDSWDLNDAQVACRQLGFPGVIRATQGGAYLGGSGPIHLDNVGCEESESYLDYRSHRGIGVGDCSHSEDAGVVCRPRVRLVDSSTAWEGRVEVFLDDYWGTICDNSWDLRDANVICRQLGYDRASAATTSAAFGRGDELYIILDEVACQGDERTVLDCPHGGFWYHNCDHSEDAGVRCDSCVSNPCANGATCTNVLDGFICSCPTGYDGLTCADGVLMVTSGQQSEYLPGDSVEYDCPDGYHLSGSVSRICQSDFTWSGQRAECHLELCSSGPCENGATCTNAPGSFTCLCPDGYGGPTCLDVLAAKEKISGPMIPIAGGGAGAFVLILIFFIAVLSVAKRRKARPQTNHPVQTGRITEISSTIELQPTNMVEVASLRAASTEPSAPVYQETALGAGATCTTALNYPDGSSNFHTFRQKP